MLQLYVHQVIIFLQEDLVLLVQLDNLNVIQYPFLQCVNLVFIYQLQQMELKVVFHVLPQVALVMQHVLDSIQHQHHVQLVLLVQVFLVMLVQDMDSIQDQSQSPLQDQLQSQHYHVMHVQQELQHVHNHQPQMQLKIQFLYVNLDII